MGIKYIWYKDLYVGQKALKHKNSMIKRIEKGRLCPEVFLITLPANKNGNMLDIYPSLELKQPFYRDSTKYVVGIAKGKDEAIEIVTGLIEDMYAAGRDFDVGRFLNFGEEGGDYAGS